MQTEAVHPNVVETEARGIAELRSILADRGGGTFATFAERLFSGAPAEDLAPYAGADLLALAETAFAALGERPVGHHRIRLHDRDLNSVPPFDVRNPSAENVALWVAEEIRRAGVLAGGVRLEEVTVWEGPRNSVTFRP